jgi:predicted transcriptional regulator
MNQQNIRRLVVFDKSSNKFGLISKSDMMCSNKA